MRNTRYLHQQGNRWVCRIRWPKEVWGTLGSGSFKKALGTDSREEALKRLPAALQAFNNAVEVAKGKQREAAPRPLNEGEITLLVAQWYRAAQDAFKTSPRPVQLDTQQREARRAFMESRAAVLDEQRRRIGEADYSTLHPIVEGLLDRAGLNVGRDDPSYGLLCRTLGRAWVALEETALAHMRGEFGHQAADPILRDLAQTQATEPAKAVRTSERGGRRKRMYALEGAGQEALRRHGDRLAQKGGLMLPQGA